MLGIDSQKEDYLAWIASSIQVTRGISRRTRASCGCGEPVRSGDGHGPRAQGLRATHSAGVRYDNRANVLGFLRRSGRLWEIDGAGDCRANPVGARDGGNRIAGSTSDPAIQQTMKVADASSDRVVNPQAIASRLRIYHPVAGVESHVAVPILTAERPISLVHRHSFRLTANFATYTIYPRLSRLTFSAERSQRDERFGISCQVLRGGAECTASC